MWNNPEVALLQRKGEKKKQTGDKGKKKKKRIGKEKGGGKEKEKKGKWKEEKWKTGKKEEKEKKPTKSLPHLFTVNPKEIFLMYHLLKQNEIKKYIMLLEINFQLFSQMNSSKTHEGTSGEL